MEKKRFLGYFLTIALLVCCIFAPKAFPLMIQVTTEQLANWSKLILIGEVAEIESFWDDAHNMIYTDVTITLEENIKGKHDKSQVTVRTQGGKVDETLIIVEDVARFTIGEKVLVFLSEGKEELLWVTADFQGKYTIVGQSIAPHPNLMGKEVSKQQFVDKIRQLVREIEK